MNSTATIEPGLSASINDRLHLVTGNVMTDAEGTGSLAVLPAVAGDRPDDSETVEWSEPSRVIRLTQATAAADWGPGQVMEVMGLRLLETRGL